MILTRIKLILAGLASAVLAFLVLDRRRARQKLAETKARLDAQQAVQAIERTVSRNRETLKAEQAARRQREDQAAQEGKRDALDNDW